MLRLERRTPRQFINPLLSRRSIASEELERFITARDTYLRELESQLVSGQSEPNIVSNALKPYCESLGYTAQSYSQRGQSGMDLVSYRSPRRVQYFCPYSALDFLEFALASPTKICLNYEQNCSIKNSDYLLVR